MDRKDLRMRRRVKRNHEVGGRGESNAEVVGIKLQQRGVLEADRELQKS